MPPFKYLACGVSQGVCYGFLCLFGFIGGAVDTFARLIRALFLFGLFVSSVSSWSFEAIAPTKAFRYSCSGFNGTITGALSPEIACKAAINKTTYDGYTRFKATLESCDPPNGQSGVNCVYYYQYDSGGAGYGPKNYAQTYASGTEEWGCGQDAVPRGTPGAGDFRCICQDGYMPKGTPTGSICVQYTCPPSGSYSAITQPDQAVPNAGDNLCSGGCSQKPSSWKVGTDGKIWATWPFKSTGSFCGGDKVRDNIDSGEKNTKNPAPIPCGLNQCPGQVNGQDVCVPCKAQADSGSTSAASAPAGTAPDGSPTGGDTTTTTKSQCDGINCTTTKTTVDSTGKVTASQTDTKPQETFCKENPQSPLCKPSSFSGTCSAVACEGDAVACAIAADQYKRNCEWFDDPKAKTLASAGEAQMTGDSRPSGHPGNDASSQSVSFSNTIDQTDRLGGACPTDVSVVIMGKSFVIGFSQMCSNLQLIGSLMVGFCMFCAALIVFRG